MSQSFLARHGFRCGTLGSAATLAIAAPTAEGNPDPAAHTGGGRIGFYFGRTASAEKIGVVIMGTERFAMTVAGASVTGDLAVSGSLTVGSFAPTNLSIPGTLAVTGVTTLNNNVVLTGANPATITTTGAADSVRLQVVDMGLGTSVSPAPTAGTASLLIRAEDASLLYLGAGLRLIRNDATQHIQFEVCQSAAGAGEFQFNRSRGSYHLNGTENRANLASNDIVGSVTYNGYFNTNYRRMVQLVTDTVLVTGTAGTTAWDTRWTVLLAAGTAGTAEALTPFIQCVRTKGGVSTLTVPGAVNIGFGAAAGVGVPSPTTFRDIGDTLLTVTAVNGETAFHIVATDPGATGMLVEGDATFTSSVTVVGTLTANSVTPGNLVVNQICVPDGSGAIIGYADFTFDPGSNTIDLNGTITMSGALNVFGNTNLNDTLFVSLTANFDDSTASTDTLTGAVIVVGGVGIGGSLNIGGPQTIADGSASVDAVSGALVVVGGVGIGERLNVTGDVGLAGVVSLTNATGSTTAGTGALVVTGGVGVGGALHVTGVLGLAGIVSVTNATASTTAGTGAVVVTGGVGIGGRLHVTGAVAFAGITSITNATAASSTSTGAVVVTGGVGIGGALHVGGTGTFTGAVSVAASTAAGHATRKDYVDGVYVESLGSNTTTSAAYVAKGTPISITITAGTWLIFYYAEVSNSNANRTNQCAVKQGATVLSESAYANIAASLVGALSGFIRVVIVGSTTYDLHFRTSSNTMTMINARLHARRIA